MCTLLGLDEDQKAWFLQEIIDPKSQVRAYYDQGVAIGEYNQDVELAKQGERGDVLSIIQLNKIQEERRLNQIQKDLFGV